VAMFAYGTSLDCDADASSQLACEDAGKGYGFLLFLWFLGFTPLGIAWVAALPWRRSAREGGPVDRSRRTIRLSPVAFLALVFWLLIAGLILVELSSSGPVVIHTEELAKPEMGR